MREVSSSEKKTGGQNQKGSIVTGIIIFLLLTSGPHLYAKKFNIIKMDYIAYDETRRSPNYLFYPITYYFNTAFDGAQTPRAFKEYHYFKKHGRLFKQLKDPIASVNKDGGFKKLFKDEWASPRAVPNYTLHLMGGGYDFRMLAEWYDSHGVPLPYLFAFITGYAANIGNEAIETSNPALTSHDHIADLFFFDLVGKLLFMSNNVTRFFHDTVQLRNWGGQPMLDARNMRVINAGSYYIVRPFLFQKWVRPFFLMGMQYLGGVSLWVTEDTYLSIAAGYAVTGPFDPNNNSNAENFKKTRIAGALFLDHKDNLMASLMINATEGYKIRLNLYPELLQFDKFNFGLFFALDDYNRPLFGINFYSVFGLGVMVH